MNILRAFIPALLPLLFIPSTVAGSNVETIYSSSGTYPIGLTYANGALFGVSDSGALEDISCGSVFELQPPAVAGDAWTETTLYSFDISTDGCGPSFAPVTGPSGEIYGVTSGGGAYNSGAVYELQPPASPGEAWTERVLYSLGAPAGNIGFEDGPLLPGPDGSFFLLTTGGVHGYGGLLHLLPPASPGGDWTGNLVYSFPEYTLADSLVSGPNGVFYGTTLYGATPGGGVFQLTPPSAPGEAWTYTALYNLPIERGVTLNSLTVDTDGTIYGTAYGFSNYGTGPGFVFSLTPPAAAGGNWAFTLLKNFGGYHPDQTLIIHDGNLYGAIASNHDGGVFELQPPAAPGGEWAFTFLHSFTGTQATSGTSYTGGAFVMDPKGTIYGATQDIYAEPVTGTVYQLATQ